MVDFLNWIVEHPTQSCIIALFAIGILSEFHPIEISFTKKNKDKKDED